MREWLESVIAEARQKRNEVFGKNQATYDKLGSLISSAIRVRETLDN